MLRRILRHGIAGLKNKHLYDFDRYSLFTSRYPFPDKRIIIQCEMMEAERKYSEV